LDDEAGKQCLICQDDITPEDNLTSCCSCNIDFHAICINTWWESAPNPNCPHW
jgi:hypothetical protein